MMILPMKPLQLHYIRKFRNKKPNAPKSCNISINPTLHHPYSPATLQPQNWKILNFITKKHLILMFLSKTHQNQTL